MHEAALLKYFAFPTILLNVRKMTAAIEATTISSTLVKAVVERFCNLVKDNPNYLEVASRYIGLAQVVLQVMPTSPYRGSLHDLSGASGK